MKTLILAILLCFAPVAVTGCKTSTAQATLAADKSVVETAKTTLRAWAVYYVAERKRLTAAGETQKLAALEQQRVRVTDSWKQYQLAATAIVLAQQANFANSTNGLSAQVSGSIAAVALPFIQLANSLLPR